MVLLAINSTTPRFFLKIAESKATTMGHIQRKHLTEAKVFHPSIEITKK